MPFSTFAAYPLLTLFVVIVVAFWLMAVLSSPRRQGSRTCAACRTDNPDYAAFCRRCGRTLGG